MNTDYSNVCHMCGAITTGSEMCNSCWSDFEDEGGLYIEGDYTESEASEFSSGYSSGFARGYESGYDAAYAEMKQKRTEGRLVRFLAWSLKQLERVWKRKPKPRDMDDIPF